MEAQENQEIEAVEPQPVEQAAPNEEVTLEAAPEGAETPADRDEKGRFRGVQPRIDELTRKRHEAEREAAYWRGVATQGKAQPSADQTAAPQKPMPEQFADYGAYVEALASFKAEEKVTQALSRHDAANAEKHNAANRESEWQKRQSEARTAIPDYEQVIAASDATLAKHVAESIMDSDKGPALAYHLAKNPALLERLNAMPVRQADREIGRLEAALAVAPQAKTTTAPRPASTSANAGRSTAPALANASMEEYIAQRSKQGAIWAR